MTTKTQTTIKAKDIKPGTIVAIYAGTEQVSVTEIVSKWGAVQVTDGNGRWYGLGENETVTISGHFNP